MRRFVGVLLVCVLLAGCGGGSSGDRIAFTSDRDGDPEIFVMNADGTKVRSQRAKPAPPVALTARKTATGSTAPGNAPPSPS